MREFFMETPRIGFSVWRSDDLSLASRLWGDVAVTKHICASGKFTAQETADRLNTEVQNGELFGVQYWPIFELESGEFMGCCGLRPYEEDFEIGFHLRPTYWGRGFAKEGARAVISHAFEKLNIKRIFAGHHPENMASKKLLLSLGFKYAGEFYYDATGLLHPSYIIGRE